MADLLVHSLYLLHKSKNDDCYVTLQIILQCSPVMHCMAKIFFLATKVKHFVWLVMQLLCKLMTLQPLSQKVDNALVIKL
jgi:hypothetical protein